MTNPLTILCGDALEQIRLLPPESVQCCVTSPPYWGLRDYGTAKWEGGDNGCDHWQKQGQRHDTVRMYGPNSQELSNLPFPSNCGLRSARRIDTQMGLEKTPEEYVAKLVAVFQEVRRILRRDGTLWLNLGDSYASGKGTCYNPGGNTSSFNVHLKAQNVHPLDRGNKSTLAAQGLKPKDLIGIPWRVAFALQASGWWLRSDIIWAKPNPMPESVTDRPTKSHEYMFLLSKSARYFYDAEAIKEQSTWAGKIVTLGEKSLSLGQANGANVSKSGNALVESVTVTDNRNKRSVWTVATSPYPEAHFATYPPDLIKPCILAGTKPGDVVLDPFAGSGTTGAVALELGRRATLIELNPKYVELIRQRCNITPGLQLA